MSAVWDDIGQRVREVARQETTQVSPPVQRFRVTNVLPLRLEEVQGDVILEEGDPDVELAGTLLLKKRGTRVIAIGDLAYAHQDSGGDWIVSGFVKGENADGEAGEGDDVLDIDPEAGLAIIVTDGPPSDGAGVEGQFAIDPDPGVLYGPKGASVWPTPGLSLVGPTGPTGPTGPAGGTGGTGPSGPAGGANWKGAWVSATVYAVNDLVSNGGYWWRCVTATTSSDTTAPPSSTKWTLWAARVTANPSGASLTFTPRVNAIYELLSSGMVYADTSGANGRVAYVKQTHDEADIQAWLQIAYIADFGGYRNSDAETWALNSIREVIAATSTTFAQTFSLSGYLGYWNDLIVREIAHA